MAKESEILKRRKIIYIGDTYTSFTTHFETQLYLFLKKKYAKEIVAIPSYNIHFARYLIKSMRDNIIILNFDFTKFNLSFLAPVFLLLATLFLKCHHNKIIVIFHGPSIYSIRDIDRAFTLNKLNILIGLYIYFISMILSKLSKLYDATIVFTPIDKRKIPRSILVYHGVPVLSSTSGYKYDSAMTKRIVYYGTLTPRKPLHLFIPLILHFLKQGYEFYILSTLRNRWHKNFYAKLIKSIPYNFHIKIKLFDLPIEDLKIREKYLRNSFILIPHCLDITPLYTFFDCLAFSRRILIPKLSICDSDYIDFLNNFLKKGIIIKISDTARLIAKIIEQLEND